MAPSFRKAGIAAGAGRWGVGLAGRTTLGVACANLLLAHPGTGFAATQVTVGEAHAGASAPAGVRTRARTPAGPDDNLPISLDAAATDIDYKTNSITFKDVVISQGETRVQAATAHATGLNFDNSRWTFDGNVRIDAERRGNLRSDAAVVEFRENHIARATITGNPAEFEQRRPDSESLARGHADEIVYDLSDGTVRLSREAWLSDGSNEISGPQIVYNIRDEKFQAAAPDGSGAGSGGRVHITIAPGSGGLPQGTRRAPGVTLPGQPTDRAAPRPDDPR